MFIIFIKNYYEKCIYLRFVVTYVLTYAFMYIHDHVLYIHCTVDSVLLWTICPSIGRSVGRPDNQYHHHTLQYVHYCTVQYIQYSTYITS